MADDTKARMEQAAETFKQAATALVAAIADGLDQDSPEWIQRIEMGIEKGERLVVALEISPEAPLMWLSMIDDYQSMRRIMTLPTRWKVKH